MGTNVTLTAADGHSLGAYQAEPAGTPKGAVVIVQEIFGVNSHIRSVVDRFAEAGYRTIAPALFDRAQPGVELGYDEDTMKEGFALRGQVTWENALADIGAGVEAVRSGGKVAVVGYCWGGSIAWMAADSLTIDAASGWYGGQIHDELARQPKCPVQLHFGTEDHSIPNEKVEAIRAAHPDIPVYVYDGAGHGFNCDDRGSYHADASGLATQRTLEFLAENIG